MRDTSLTALHGRYVYADLCAGVVRSVALPPNASGDRRGPHAVTPTPNQIRVLRAGRAGCVYVAAQTGKVYRLASPGGAAPCPAGGGRGDGRGRAVATPVAAAPVAPAPAEVVVGLSSAPPAATPADPAPEGLRVGVALQHRRAHAPRQDVACWSARSGQLAAGRSMRGDRPRASPSCCRSRCRRTREKVRRPGHRRGRHARSRRVSPGARARRHRPSGAAAGRAPCASSAAGTPAGSAVADVCLGVLRPDQDEGEHSADQREPGADDERALEALGQRGRELRATAGASPSRRRCASSRPRRGSRGRARLRPAARC